MDDTKFKTTEADFDPKFGKLIGAFATNQELEQNGVWRTHQETGLRVRIRRSTLPEYKRAVRKHYKPYAHLTKIDPKEELLVKQKAAAEALVADWEIGTDLKPTEANVLEAMKTIPDFYDWVQGEADTFEHFRIERIEDDSGNLSTSSTGSASGGEGERLPSLSGERQGELASPTPPGVLS